MAIQSSGKSVSDIVHGTAKANKAVILDNNLRTDRLVVAEEVTFVEDGKTTYTGNVVIPAGAYLLDVIVHAVALWDDGTSASMDVGFLEDPNGIYQSIDVKATDLLAAESVGFGFAGGVEGDADLFGGESAGDQFIRRYSASQREVTGVIVTGGQDGTAGRTRMVVVYVLPTTSVAPGV